MDAISRDQQVHEADELLAEVALERRSHDWSAAEVGGQGSVFENERFEPLHEDRAQILERRGVAYLRAGDEGAEAEASEHRRGMLRGRPAEGERRPLDLGVNRVEQGDVDRGRFRRCGDPPLDGR